MKLPIAIRFLTMTAIAVITLVLTAGSRANAAFVLTLQQTGGNVVASGSGSFNLSALASQGTSTFDPLLYPSNCAIFAGSTPSDSATEYFGLTGPSNFGTGSAPAFAASGSGSLSGIDGESYLLVPAGYTSGTELTDSATWSSATLSSLGVTPGTYTWTWGSGASADSFTLTASTGAVPEPSSWVMLLCGFGALGLIVRKRRTNGANPGPYLSTE